MENREKKETESTNCDTSKDKNVINNDDFSSKNKVDSQAIGLSSDKESQEACKVVKNGKYDASEKEKVNTTNVSSSLPAKNCLPAEIPSSLVTSKEEEKDIGDHVGDTKTSNENSFSSTSKPTSEVNTPITKNATTFHESEAQHDTKKDSSKISEQTSSQKGDNISAMKALTNSPSVDKRPPPLPRRQSQEKVYYRQNGFKYEIFILSILIK